MLYAGVFKRYPDITFVFSHCGGALPVFAGRLSLLGTESWVSNPEGLTRQNIEEQLGSLWLDTAATVKTGLLPATCMVSCDKMVYGADCGVPCSTEHTMEENRKDLIEAETKAGRKAGGIGMRT